MVQERRWSLQTRNRQTAPPRPKQWEPAPWAPGSESGGMGSFKEPSQEAALPRTTSSFTNTGQQVYLQHQDRDKAPGDDGGPRFGEGANLGNG